MAKSWRDDAACPDSGLDFFTNNTQRKYDARAVCMSQCPVRWDCLQYALAHQELFGIWGGVDEYEIRRTLSVNWKGEPVHRARKPRCPFCRKSALEDVVKKRARKLVRCTTCELEWWIKRAPRQVSVRPDTA